MERFKDDDESENLEDLKEHVEWISPSTRRLIDKKNRAYKAMKKFPSLANERKFAAIRKEVKKVIRKEKIELIVRLNASSDEDDNEEAVGCTKV